MKRSSPHAFTLVEMLMVMLIIAIIASLIVSVASLANKKGTMSKAQAEITALATACESYKADNGTYPRLAKTTEQDTAGATSPIDPRTDGDPSQKNYQAASLFLYQQLSGDSQAVGHPDAGVKPYFEFKITMLAGMTGGLKGNGKVLYLQDPFGFSYGYSTAANRAEEDFRAQATIKAGATRPTTPVGFNSTFDLWSTGGLNTTTGLTDQVRARWVKNW